MSKRIERLLLISFVVVLITGLILLWNMGYLDKYIAPNKAGQVSDGDIKNSSTQSLTEMQPDKTASVTPLPAIRPQKTVWDEMHRMSNTLIVSDMIWGQQEITKTRVDELIREVGQSDFDDRDKLLSILDNWSKQDFSHAVDEHNYLWGKLNGNIGKATGLKPSINAAK